MSNAAPLKICRDCGKDVSAIKRVKDAQGRYQCEACMTAKSKAADASPAPVAVSPRAVPTDDTYDLMPAAPVVKQVKQTTVRPAAASPVTASVKPAAGTAKLPEFCPNCEAPVLPNRKICIKCRRDVTQMDKLVAMKAEAEKGPSKEEKIAGLVGRGMKWGLILAGVAVAVITIYGIWSMFHPAGPFDEFPTKNVETISRFMKDVATGTPAGYDKAFYLMSFRERTTNNVNEIDNYKRLFATIHDALVKKHGEGWDSRMKIERLSPADESGENFAYAVTIDSTEYHVTTQVQISVDQAVVNMASRSKSTYAEDGKNHFGILEVEEFPLLTKHKEKPAFEVDRGGGGVGE